MDLLQGIVVRWNLVSGTTFLEIHPNSHEFDSYKQISSLTLCQHVEVERGSGYTSLRRGWEKSFNNVREHQGFQLLAVSEVH